MNPEKEMKNFSTSKFEIEKIKSLNQFFMRSITQGLIFAFLLFILTAITLLSTMIITDMDSSVKITIISMVATFVLTNSKALIDHTIEVVRFNIRILGEEQRGFNRKMGIEMDVVELEESSNESDKTQNTPSGM